MSAEVIEDNSSTTASEFWAGVRVGFPVTVASAPFAFLFGVIATDNGFSVSEAVLMSATVYAGASQMVCGMHTMSWEATTASANCMAPCYGCSYAVTQSISSGGRPTRPIWSKRCQKFQGSRRYARMHG